MGALYRHEPVCGSYCDGPRMEYRADGDWVRVEDFDAAEKQRDDALAEIERLREVVQRVQKLAWSPSTDAIREIRELTQEGDR